MRGADYGEKLPRNSWRVKNTFFAIAAARYGAANQLRFADSDYGKTHFFTSSGHSEFA